MAAEAEDEIPIGAVIVFGGRVIAKGHNMTDVCMILQRTPR